MTHKTGSYRYCFTCARHLFIHFSSSRYDRWRKPLLYDSAAADIHRPVPIRALFSICISSPFSRRHVRQRCGTSTQSIPISSMSRISLTATALSFRQAGTVRERSWCCATASTQKRWGEAWECGPSSDAGIDSDSDSGGRKCTRPSYRTKAPAYPLLTPRSRSHSHPSTTRCPNKHYSQRTTTRAPAAPTVTSAAYSALIQMHPQRLVRAPSGSWACRPPHFRLSNVR